jgi:hypothetical protein
MLLKLVQLLYLSVERLKLESLTHDTSHKMPTVANVSLGHCETRMCVAYIDHNENLSHVLQPVQ